MATFQAALNQTAFLLTFIALGYFLIRGKHLPEAATAVLSRLENCVFVPALVLETFLKNFRVERLSVTGDLLLRSTFLALCVIAVSLVCVRFCTKDPYHRNLYLYGLCFSNFGFMGNAVVNALFPEIFLEYILFTLPLWTLIYLWGVPVLLMGDSGAKASLSQRLKNFCNPMFVAMVIGMVLGLTAIPVPGFLTAAISAAGSCMSPIAMLLTGMTVAQYDLKEILTIRSLYRITALRLAVYPLVFLGVLAVLPMPRVFSLCALCALAMPLGLNTIIIPSAQGKDTSVAAGMALVSHVLSCLTIPVIFLLLEYVV